MTLCTRRARLIGAAAVGIVVASTVAACGDGTPHAGSPATAVSTPAPSPTPTPTPTPTGTPAAASPGPGSIAVPAVPERQLRLGLLSAADLGAGWTDVSGEDDDGADQLTDVRGCASFVREFDDPDDSPGSTEVVGEFERDGESGSEDDIEDDIASDPGRSFQADLRHTVKAIADCREFAISSDDDAPSIRVTMRPVDLGAGTSGHFQSSGTDPDDALHGDVNITAIGPNTVLLYFYIHFGRRTAQDDTYYRTALAVAHRALDRAA